MNFDLTRTIEILERTPATLRVMLGGLSDAWTQSNEGGESWSAFDIVGHLIDGEETDWMTRARLILAQGSERTFQPFDRLRHKEKNRGKTLGELLDRFEALRAKNLKELHDLELTPDHLRLTGKHPALGPASLQQLLSTWAVHDLNHIWQVARVMAWQLRDEVGPWEAYLGVLKR